MIVPQRPQALLAAARRCLGFAPSLCPTLLGLRLLTDLQAGGASPIPAALATTTFAPPCDLLWAPSGPVVAAGSALAAPPLTGPPPRRLLVRPALLPAARSGAATPWSAVDTPAPALRGEATLGDAVRALASMCCQRDFFSEPKLFSNRSALECATPHALAWLLANALCQGRADASSLLQECGEASLAVLGSLSAAEQLRVLGALREQVGALLPGEFRLCFQAGVDLLRGSLQQHLASEGTSPADEEERVLVEEWTGELLLARAVDVVGGVHTPPLRLLLVAASEVPAHVQAATPGLARDMVPHAASLLEALAGMRAATEWWMDLGGWAVRGTSPRASSTRHVVDVARVACVPDRGAGSSRSTEALRLAFHLPVGALGSTSPPGHDFFVVAFSLLLQGVMVGAPVRLSTFSCARRAPPAALARCLLKPPGGPLEQQQGGGSAEQASAAPSGSAAWTLQLAGPVTETAEAYQLQLQLTSAAGGGGSSGSTPAPSGLHVAVVPHISAVAAPAATDGSSGRNGGASCCPSSHVVRVALEQPAGVVSLELLLGWPVAAGLGEPDEAVAACRYSSGSGVRALLRRSAARVELTLRKAEVSRRAACAVRGQGRKQVSAVLSCVRCCLRARAQAWERWPADLAPQGPPVMVASATSGGGKQGSKARAVSSAAQPSAPLARSAESTFVLGPGAAPALNLGNLPRYPGGLMAVAHHNAVQHTMSDAMRIMATMHTTT